MGRELGTSGRLMLTSAEPRATPGHALQSFSFWLIAPEQRRHIDAFASPLGGAFEAGLPREADSR